jgi:serine/threonine protein kinase
MDKYAEYLDTKTGALKFKGKAVVHGHGIEFSSGRSFSISLDEVDTLDELGKGNYGTVYKVRHSRPKFRRTGQGLAGNRARGPLASSEDDSPTSPTRVNSGDLSSAPARGGTGVVMAMKEIRLELDDAKFSAIIMELDILHRCLSPHIVDFYGAFFQEGAVYICMEFMDGGSIDRLYGAGIPEGVLRKITLNTVLGLKSLKEEHNIIHRDVKPTNILVNSKGQVKICDFGVSGNLVASIAKTNIGCQSYMAPERISSGGVAQAGAGASGGTYSVQSDIWSLGLTIIECAMGRYPYPPETYDNIFSQLSVSRYSLQPLPNYLTDIRHCRRSSTAHPRTCPPTPSAKPVATSSPAASTRFPNSAPRTPCCCSTPGSRPSPSPQLLWRRTKTLPKRRPMLRLNPPQLRRASWTARSASGCSGPWIRGAGAWWARPRSPRCIRRPSIRRPRRRMRLLVPWLRSERRGILVRGIGPSFVHYAHRPSERLATGSLAALYLRERRMRG